jgi:hypothetical protein
MTIESDLTRIATALERIADNCTPQAATVSAPIIPEPVAVATPAKVDLAAAAATRKKPGPKPKAAPNPEPAPAATAELSASPSNEGVAAAAEAPAPETPVVETDRADADDFLGDSAPEAAEDPPATLDDVRAALLAYAGRKGATGRADAQKLLKHLSGVDNLTAFTDKAMYGAVVKAVKAAV